MNIFRSNVKSSTIHLNNKLEQFDIEIVAWNLADFSSNAKAFQAPLEQWQHSAISTIPWWITVQSESSP